MSVGARAEATLGFACFGDAVVVVAVVIEVLAAECHCILLLVVLLTVPAYYDGLFVSLFPNIIFITTVIVCC